MFTYAFRSISVVLTALSLMVSVNIHTRQTDGQRENTAIAVASPTQLSVHILQSDAEISYALQQATEIYREETHTDTVFHIQTVSGRSDYRAALRSKLLSGEKADLVHLLDSTDATRLEDALVDLSGLGWATPAYCGVLQPVGVEKITGIPYQLEGIGLIANRNIFSAAGIPLDTISDYGSLSEAIADLQAAIDAGDLADSFPELTAVTDLAVQDIDYLGTRVAELLLAGAFTSPRYAGAAPTLHLPNADSAETFLQLMAAASPQRGNWPAFAQVSAADLLENGLAAERIAMILESTAVYPRLLEANPELAGQLVLLPIYLENSENGSVFLGSPSWWGVNANAGAAVQQQAIAFLQWLYTSETGSRLLAEEFGILSPYPASGAANVSLHRQLLAQIDAGVTLPQLALEAPADWPDQVAAPQLNEYFTIREKTWEEVISACKEGWRQQRSS